MADTKNKLMGVKLRKDMVKEYRAGIERLSGQ